MNTFEKLIKSWWVLFPFSIIFPGFGFIYVGYRSSNRNWIIEGITYQLPIFFYFVASAIFPAAIMIRYYIWIILLAAAIALFRSIMLALKLTKVYDIEDRPKISSSANTSQGSSVSDESKKDRDFDLKNCCGCIILIFVIFAVISILL